MIDVGTSTNGGRRQFHISATTISAVASTLGLVVFIFGFISGALTFKESVSTLQAGNIEIKNILGTLSTRVTVIETESKYTSQGIAELKVSVGTRR